MINNKKGENPNVEGFMSFDDFVILKDKYEEVQSRLIEVDELRYNISEEIKDITKESINLMLEGERVISWCCENCESEPSCDSEYRREYDSLQNKRKIINNKKQDLKRELAKLDKEEIKLENKIKEFERILKEMQEERDEYDYIMFRAGKVISK